MRPQDHLGRLPEPRLPLADYNAAMRHTLGSKLFFLEKLPLDEIGQWVDFGCADGSLLKALHRVSNPKRAAEFIGVDNDPRQVQACRAHFPEVSDLCPDLKTACKLAPEWGARCLIFSSVIHEVLSGEAYPERKFWAWWQEVEKLKADYIVIRDFGVTERAYLWQTPQAWVDAVKQDPALASRLDDVEARYGSRWQRYHFIHFLLKYPYGENWERELAENYLAIPHEVLTSAVMANDYQPIHVGHTTTKHFRTRVRDDLGITDLPSTHVELILKRRTKSRCS